VLIVKNLIKLSLVGALLVLPTAFAGVKPLKEPEPVAIPASLSQAQVTSAIKKGMSRRGWRVEKEEPNKILAVIYVRTHVVKNMISWDKKEVHISYVDSTNMKYEMREPKSSGGGLFDFDDDKEKKAEPVPYIHSRYNSWSQNLANDIRNELDYAASSSP
jgi:hypothetical protein